VPLNNRESRAKLITINISFISFRTAIQVHERIMYLAWAICLTKFRVIFPGIVAKKIVSAYLCEIMPALHVVWFQPCDSLVRAPHISPATANHHFSKELTTIAQDGQEAYESDPSQVDTGECTCSVTRRSDFVV
jgi:hypothetical protein